MVSDGGSNQKLLLFVRGNAVAGAPSIKGTDQFTKPPVRNFINKKEVITKVWAMTLNLQILSCVKRDSGCPNSVRISILRDVSTIPDQAPDTEYNFPLSLYIVEKNHRIKISGVSEIIVLAIGCKIGLNFL